MGRTRLAVSRRRRLATPRRENRLRLALLGPLLGLALGAAGAFAVTSVWGPHIAEARAVDRAEVSAVEIAESTVGPLVTTDLLSDDGTAYGVLDEALRALSSDGSIGRVQVRDATGRVMYAVEPALVGRRLPLAEEHHRILQTGGSDAQSENAETEANEATLSEPSPTMFASPSSPGSAARTASGICSKPSFGPLGSATPRCDSSNS